MPGLGIVRRLPAPLRKLSLRGIGLLRKLVDESAEGDQVDARSMEKLLGLPPRPEARCFAGTRVVVAGLFGSRCGLQRGADLMVLDFRAKGVEVLPFDVTSGLNIVRNIDAIAGSISEPGEMDRWQPTDIVVHMNPPLFAQVLALFPVRLLSRVTVIGYWAWELNVLPSTWQICARFCDEIWTPSPFVAEAAAAGLPDFAGKIRVVPHASDRDPMYPASRIARTALRAAFDIEENVFVLGTSFSFNSNYARKNPCAAIDAFRFAFRGDERVRLILRCNDTDGFRQLFEHLVSFAGDDMRIVLWDAAEVACSIRQFYDLIDLYVSLHRSEGYGLNLIEAAQAGLPVVTTGWGLAPDIAGRPEVRTVNSRLITVLDSQQVYNRYPGARWAEPDLLEAATELTKAYDAWLTAPSQPAG